MNLASPQIAVDPLLDAPLSLASSTIGEPTYAGHARKVQGADGHGGLVGKTAFHKTICLRLLRLSPNAFMHTTVHAPCNANVTNNLSFVRIIILNVNHMLHDVIYECICYMMYI